MRPVYQVIEITQRSENRINRPIVRYIIAKVLHRGCEKRRQPDRVDAERGDVVELCDNSWKISDAIAIGIAKAPGIDLINHGAVPPWRRLIGILRGRPAHGCPARRQIWPTKG